MPLPEYKYEIESQITTATISKMDSSSGHSGHSSPDFVENTAPTAVPRQTLRSFLQYPDEDYDDINVADTYDHDTIVPETQQIPAANVNAVDNQRLVKKARTKLQTTRVCTIGPGLDWRQDSRVMSLMRAPQRHLSQRQKYVVAGGISVDFSCSEYKRCKCPFKLRIVEDNMTGMQDVFSICEHVHDSDTGAGLPTAVRQAMQPYLETGNCKPKQVHRLLTDKGFEVDIEVSCFSLYIILTCINLNSLVCSKSEVL